MIPLLVLIGLFALSAFTNASPILEDYHVFESVPAPDDWVAGRRPAPSTRLDVRIHLAQQRVSDFERKLVDMSTPGHLTYGQHMSHAAIKDMLEPSEDTKNSVKTWINSKGFSDKLCIESDWLYMTAPVSFLESLLQAEYRVFKNARTGEEKLGTLAFSLPSSLHKHISMIHPTTRIGGPQPSRDTIKYVKPASKIGATKAVISAETIDASCNSTITIACLEALYGFGSYVPTTTPATLGVAGFLEQWAQYSDLSSFLKMYDAENTNNFSVALINGGVNTQSNTSSAVEADLDIEYAVGISGDVPVTYYSTGGRPPIVGNGTNDNEPYLEFLQYFLALPDEELPRTISISYGESEQSVPTSYALTVCNLFAQLSARGVSILTASGDSGPGGTCRSNDGTNRLKFTPLFPASCPWVTAVGGTIYVEPEAAVSFSGGGFSDLFIRPDWQNEAVGDYLEKGYSSEFKEYFNASGRAIPDVSAQGDNYHVIYHGRDVLVGGTSASTPAFSAIINLVNNELLARGKSPLGFLNPWLYSKAKNALTDITTGNSTGCDSTIPGAGFPAVEGWDAVTGLGTPLFQKLLEATRLAVYG